MSSSRSSPAILIELLTTTPPKDITATSVVPPPISTIIFPLGSAMSIFAPIAAAIGSSIKYTSFAPACNIDSSTALSSTSVIPEGTPTTTLGFPILYLWHILYIIFLSINWVAVKSAITPSFSGLTAFILSGVLPSISFASYPVARISLVFISNATTEGSFKIIPFPFRVTSILAVPKSIPISFEPNPKNFILITFSFLIFDIIKNTFKFRISNYYMIQQFYAYN